LARNARSQRSRSFRSSFEQYDDRRSAQALLGLGHRIQAAKAPRRPRHREIEGKTGRSFTRRMAVILQAASIEIVNTSGPYTRPWLWDHARAKLVKRSIAAPASRAFSASKSTHTTRISRHKQRLPRFVCSRRCPPGYRCPRWRCPCERFLREHGSYVGSTSQPTGG